MIFADSMGINIDPIVLILIVGASGFILGALLIFLVPFFKKLRAQGQAKKIIREAEIKAEHITKNAQLDGKQAVMEMKQEANREIQEREQNIDRRDQALTSKEQSLDDKNETLNRRLKDIDKKEAQLQVKIDSIISELEKVAQMSSQEAHDELFARVESKMASEVALYMKNKEEEAKEECEQKAKEMLGLAISKYAQEVTTEKCVSVVVLPNDEMKGRIIGREGRNIRSLEQLLGVDLIIDDTPEVITVSCFNPIRREIARLSLENLIKDGRIQPGRIEEIVEKAKKEIDESIHKTGQDIAFKLGLPRINRELLD